MKYDAIIVGGGIAGLTSAAYLTKNGYKVLLCEKEDHIGGLVNSFEYDGFLFDGGVRGIVDSGVVKPMFKQLGIEIEFLKSIVTIGIEDEIVRVEDLNSLKDYRNMLVHLYPEQEKDIDLILDRIHVVMDYMDVLYGIENPLFKDLKQDKQYLTKTLVPWLFKFISKSGKIKHFQVPVDEYLETLTKSQSLIDIISQHFFQKTPASFALSYFSLYLDYEYPKNGTSQLVETIKEYCVNLGTTILFNTMVRSIDVNKTCITDQNGQQYEYKELVWAADMKQLYQAIDVQTITHKKTKQLIEQKKELLVGKKGGDSIYSVFLAVDMDPSFFGSYSSAHCFYTPKKTGQSSVFNQLRFISKSQSKESIIDWMKLYLEYTTYEIAIPSLRNSSLAPKGKTGLVVSVLMDYEFIRNINELGFYNEFKDIAQKKVIEVLNSSIYKGIKEHIIHCFSSTPLTIEKLSGNHEGAITGWAFTNDVIPSVSKTTEINKSCLTPIPNVLVAGQWTFSPAGLPVSILTGKIAADKATKNLKKGM